MGDPVDYTLIKDCGQNKAVERQVMRDRERATEPKTERGRERERERGSGERERDSQFDETKHKYVVSGTKRYIFA